MSKIVNVTIAGLKGQNRTILLTGRDFLIGPNGSGKTAVLDAIEIAVRGYHEREGKTNDATMSLCKGDRMGVGVMLDTGFCAQREYRRSDGKVAQTVQVFPADGERKITEKEARILKEIGKGTTALDLGAILDAPESKRMDFLLRFASPEGQAKVLGEFLSEYPVKALTEINRAVPILPQVAAVHEKAKAEVNEIRAVLKRSRQAKEELAAKRGEKHPKSLDEGSAIKAGNSAQTEIGRLEEQHKAFTDYQSELDRKKAGIASLEREIADLEAKPKPEFPDAEAEIAALDDRVEMAKADVANAVDDASRAVAADSRAAAVVEYHEKRLKDLQAVKDHGAECPMCGHRMDSAILEALIDGENAYLAEDVHLRRSACEKNNRAVANKRTTTERLEAAQKARKDLDSLQRDRARMVSHWEQNQARIQEKKSRLAAAQQDILREAPSWSETQEQALAVAKMEADESAKSVKEIRDYLALDRAFRETELKLGEEEEALSKVEKTVNLIGPKGLMRSILFASIEPFLARVREIVPGLGMDEDLRLTLHGVLVKTLSSGEKARVLVGIIAAVLEHDASPVKSLYVEADAMDAETLQGVVRGVNGMTWLDNVIFATCHEVKVSAPLSGWNLVSLP